MKLLFLSLIVFVAVNSYSQEATFNNPKDSTASCYITFMPKIKPVGMLILFDGYGGLPLNVPKETTLLQVATEKGLIAIAAALQDGGKTFYIDEISQHCMDTLINALYRKYNLTNEKLYLGGFSLGGSGVVKYTERATRDTHSRKPNAIFVVDAPLDFERMYNIMKRSIRLNKTGNPNKEDVFFSEIIKKQFGGTPETNIAAYRRISPYSFSDTTQRAIRQLVDMPVRYITEPDIQWWIKNRSKEVYSINVTDGSAFVNELRQLSNVNAELITTENKGYRDLQNTIRHPHSWSIADPDETITWLLKF